MERDFFDKNPTMRDIFDNIGDAVYFVDDHGSFLFMNKAAEKLDGYTLAEVKGRTVMEMYNLLPSESPLLRVVCSHEPLKEYFFRYYINDQEVYQVCNTFPVELDNGFWGSFSIQRDVTQFKKTVDRNIELQKKLFSAENDSDGERVKSNLYNFDSIIGDHPSLIRCKAMALNAAQGDSTIMLNGMTGTGKELFAQSIHSASPRAGKPFLAINCAALPENLIESLLFGTKKGAYTGAVDRKGLFVEADGGTLFLDEINSMPLSSQSKLLRAMEERVVQPLGSKEQIPFNVRVISSCNSKPEDILEKKEIREDLFYRLAVVNILIPPLSERKSDIFLLAHHFIALYNKRYGKNVLNLEDDVTGFFLDYEWPGNVRQLKHCIEGAMNLVREKEITIKRQHLPFYLFRSRDQAEVQPYSESRFEGDNRQTLASYSQEVSKKASSGILASIRQNEKETIITALQNSGGNISKAARKLGLSRSTLIYRMKKYEID